MFKPLEIFVGLRYLRAKRRNHFISFFSIISMGGIALGVAVLITVLSVMNGFVKELRERILSVASHVSVSGYTGSIDNWQELSKEILDKHPSVLGVAPYINSEGMLSSGQQVSGALVSGILPNEEAKVSDVWRNMIRGHFEQLKAGEFNIILGHGLAAKLGAIVGDKVTLVTPQAMSTPAGVLPRLKRFTVVGIYKMDHNQYDNAMSFINMKDAQRLFRLQGKASGVRIKLDDLFDAPKMRQALTQSLTGNYWITDWTRQHATIFRAVALEKRMIFLLLLLIIMVAAFNIVSTLIMVVADKQSDIAILRTLGMTPKSITFIFMVQGMVYGIFGTLIGVIGGVALAENVSAVIVFIEHLFGISFMPPDVYQISEFPSELHWDDVFEISYLAVIISLFATVVPARLASRTQPAEALRYE